MKRNMKKIAAVLLTAAFAVSSLTACSNKKKDKKEDDKKSQNLYTAEEAKDIEVMKVGDETINMDTALIYLIMSYRQYTVTEENINALPDVCKPQALSSLRETYSIYKAAMDSGITPSEEDEQQAQNYANVFIQGCSDVLDKCGISHETVYEEYRKQMIVEKFKNDEKNALGQSLTEKYQKEFGDKRFFKVYAVIFPTVEVGDDGMPKTGTDGNYVYVSEADKKTAKENAEKAREEIIGGADVEEVIEKYGVGNYSDQTTSYEGYSSDNGGKDTLEKLKNGEATEVSENKVGYIFYVMMNENDTDTRDYYIQYLASNDVDAQYEEMEAKWKNTIQIDEKGDMIGTAWDDIDMNKFGKAMIGLGVVGNEGDTTTQK